MPRIQGLTELYLTNSGLIKDKVGEVHSVTISWKGVTLGHGCFLRDGANGAAAIAVPFFFPTANGTLTKEWPQGKRFESGIYWDAGPSDAGENVYIELTYK